MLLELLLYQSATVTRVDYVSEVQLQATGKLVVLSSLEVVFTLFAEKVHVWVGWLDIVDTFTSTVKVEKSFW